MSIEEKKGGGKKVYTKPAVKGTSVPEPVEAGCCLTSCGGSPLLMTASGKRDEALSKDKDVVARAKDQISE